MQTQRRAIALAGFVWLCLSAVACAQPAIVPGQDEVQPEQRAVSPFVAPREYLCFRADHPIVIDGEIDDSAWSNAPWTEDFIDIEGARRPLPRFRTRAKMLWDDQFLYIGAELAEPHVWGTLTAHDSVIFQDNDFEVFIDPNGDNHEYYEFEINALNTGWDLLLPRPYKDGGRAVNAWEIPGLKTAVAIDGSLNDHRDTDRGWSVELAFPWSALGELAYQSAPPQNKDQWRINFSRVEWQHEIIDGRYRKVSGTKEDNWVWSPQGVIDMHRPESWALVQFSTEKLDTVEFVRNAAGPVRHLLHEVYYAQRDFRNKHSRWATTVRELGFSAEQSGLSQVTLQVAGDMFQATSSLSLPDGRQELWHIRQDSRIWKEKLDNAPSGR